jgi:hypothetical protein
MDAEMDGFATGLSTCITKDGQTTVTADIPFNNKRLTGVADATADTDALNRQAGDARYRQTGQIIRSWSTEFATLSTSSGAGLVIPADDTIPQITEGLLLLSIASVSASTATNKLRIRHSVSYSANAVDTIKTAVFNGASNAVGAAMHTNNTSGYLQFIFHEFDITPGDTTSRTYSLRVGVNVGTTTLTINGSGGARLLGGTLKSTMTIEEIKA